MSKSPILPEGRKQFLEERRRLKMAESAHAYVRGNTLQFYEWLNNGDRSKSIPSGPPVWICGDCHIGNLGPISDLKGNVDIQIRDLDQTVIGNPAHDLLRLALSLAMASRSSDLPGTTSALMAETLIDSYLHGLTGRDPSAKSTDIAPVRKVMRSAVKRKWRHLAEERIEDISPQIPLGPKFWPLTKEERKELQDVFENEENRELIEALRRGHKEGSVKMLDAAYWLKGCSSLGRVRYAVLVGVGRKSEKRYRLMDVKEAAKAVAPSKATAKIPKNNAERVVMGARNLSPFLGDRMVACTLGSRQVVVRELRPQDLKFEFLGLSPQEAILTAGLLASVVGKAHGRQMSRPERSSWTRELKRSHTKRLDAPSWLWNGVVELVAAHEAAYLQHCRNFALSAAKKKTRN